MHSAITSAELSRPTAGDFYRVNRGGGLFSEAVSQRLGAAFALLGHRLGLSPTALTLANLVLGLATSVTVVALAERVAAGTVPGWAIGLVALVGWQLAYALDCADGQLARVTGRTSPSGARVDVLCDVAAQITLVTALSTVAVAQRPSTPVWLVAAFAGTWMVNLVTSVMQSGPNAASMVPSTSLPVRLVKLIRDYGAVITLAGVVLTLAPDWTTWLVAAFTLVNGGFLLASIAFTARHASRP
ncbi:Phosphatidylglycerophosphate synthase [Micromonospora pattaloongensis]|uniref:Phosphatidylglycerophosphate synthase n=1 Tax=Micromonospora pattaloongensis TaxID=405436 RepID=A0A1H3HMC7_9ACTN|nr:CDP-alcohol phosphatidyltransferase family protein [Micromonospora pattaloongensis]SDY16686.1 Phosphatidylglycerophosphate synthase [Micromonospora pattaloongensis]